MKTVIASEIKIEFKKGWGEAGKTSEDGDGRVPHTAMATAELRRGQHVSEGTWAEVDVPQLSQNSVWSFCVIFSYTDFLARNVEFQVSFYWHMQLIELPVH